MAYEAIISERVGDVCVITLNRPETMNALNFVMTEELEDAIGAARKDGVRALLLTGAGRGFCSGADLTAGEGKGHPSGVDLLREKGLPLGYHAMLLREFPRPTIAAVNGAAVGAGFGLALACDIRISAQGARYSAIFAKRALSPDYGCTQTLPAIVGMSRALELMYTGDIIDSAEAERIGLVSRVVPDDELSEVAMALAQKLASGPSIAHALTKKMAYTANERTFEEQIWMEAQASTASGSSEDRKEGLKAFMERREPKFQGR
jgi:2-(1,2-epoxy-1,2-dihydrophenyl)acetyl-CoA isomerase